MSPSSEPFSMANLKVLRILSMEVAKDLFPYGIFQSLEVLCGENFGDTAVCS